MRGMRSRLPTSGMAGAWLSNWASDGVCAALYPDHPARAAAEVVSQRRRESASGRLSPHACATGMDAREGFEVDMSGTFHHGWPAFNAAADFRW
jgi:hypothetical protein